MKIQGRLFQIMENSMKAIIEEKGGPARVKDYFQGRSEVWIVWSLWGEAEQNLRFDDSHPVFSQGLRPRVCPQIPGFDIYSEDPGINDSHIETALKRICRNHGVL